MKAYLTSLLDLFPPGMLLQVAIVSAIVFAGSLIAIPFILVRLPADYFDVRVPRTWMKGSNPTLRMIMLVIRNVAGTLFVLAGLSMLLLPGQGLLTILIGISLMHFPGKRRLEAKIIGQRTLFRGVNALRAKFGKPEFTLAPRP